MRILLSICLMCFGLLQAFSLQAQLYSDKTDEIALTESRAFGPLYGRASDTAFKSLMSVYQIGHMDAHWEVDPAVRFIQGDITYAIEALEDSVGEIWLALNGSLNVGLTEVDGQSTGFTHKEDYLRVRLPALLDAGDEISLRIRYSGVPNEIGFGSFVQRWRKPDSTSTDSIPIIWTLSQPYGAPEWWPSKPFLDDKIDSLDIRVTVPEGNRVGTNGLLVSTDTSGDEVTFHWRHRYPIETYLVAISVTDYLVYEEDFVLGGDTIPMLHYFYREDSVYWMNNLFWLPQMMEVFTDLFGPYPFREEKYGHAQFSWTGGMEHQTMSYMSNVDFELLAHELAHSWFGNKITCSSWSDIWLNEGFATFLVGLCYERINPDFWWDWRYYNRISVFDRAPTGSVFVTDTFSVSRVFRGPTSYHKGALVLHQIRWEMGDSLFFTALRNYIDDTAIHHGYVNTDFLIGHFKAVADSFIDWKLDFLFDDYLYGEGYPEISMTWQQNPNTGIIAIYMEQAASDGSDRFFEMRPVLRAMNSVTGEYVDRRIEWPCDRERFTMRAEFEVDTIIFDPELWVLSKLVYQEQVPDELDYDFGPMIAPNPTTDRIRLFLGLQDFRDPVPAIVSDQQGRILAEYELEPQTTFNRHWLDVSQLDPGVYLLSVAVRGRRYSLRFIKE